MAEDMGLLLGWTEPEPQENVAGDLPTYVAPEEPGFWTSVSESWHIARDLDGTGAAIGRMQDASQFQLDPAYNLDNFDELMKDVNPSHKEMLSNALMDAKSAEHAQWIKDRYVHEVSQEKRLEDFGATGIVTRIGTSLADESLLLGLALAPAAAAHKVSRVARMLKFGGFAAAENALQESIVASISPTRTAEDVAYAAMFGFVFGGAIGAIGRTSAKGPSGNTGQERVERTSTRVVEDIPETTPKRERSVQEVATGAIEEMDQATVRTVKGEPVPPPPKEMQGHIAARNTALVEDLNIATRGIEEDVVPRIRMERIAELETRMAALRKTVVPAPSKPVLADELAKVNQAQIALNELAESTDRVAKVRADQAFQNAKREFMSMLKRDHVDAFIKSDLSTSPKTEDFLAWINGPGKKLATKMEEQFVKDTATYNTTLDKLDDELLALKDEHRTLTAGKPVGPKSAGSAGVAEGNVGADLVDFTEEVMDELANVPDTAFSKFRIGGYAVLNRSENPVFKWLGNVLLPDHVGSKDKNYVARPSAVLRGEQLQERVIGKYSAKYQAGFRQWATARGLHAVRRTPKVEEEFNRLVAQAIESGTDDPHVKKVANAFSDGVRETFEYAQRSGVRGFENLVHRNDYLPHIHNTEAFRRFTTDLQAGPDGAVVEVIYEGIRRAQPELDTKTARSVAKKYVNTVLHKSAGYGGKYFDMNRVIDPEYARGMFADMGMTDEEITSVLNMLSRSEKATQAGGISRVKHRTLMDMDTEITVFDQNIGEHRQLAIRELFEQNASKLMHSYVRSVGGWAAIADATKGTPIHINSPAKLESILQKGMDLEVGLGPRTGKGAAAAAKLSAGQFGTGTGAAAEAEVELLRMVTNSLTGIPINDPNSLFTIAARRLKDYNFTTMMGQVAWAQMSEMGSTIAALGWRQTLKALPQLRRALTRSRETGELDLELARVVEEFMGIGTTALRGRAHPMWVSDLDALDGNVNWIDSGLHQAKNIVAAPMHAMMTAQQRLMGIGMLQKFGDFAMGKVRLSDSELSRLRSVGIGDKELAGIKKMYAKHAKWSNMQTSSGKLLNPNFDLWEDQGAFLALRDGLFRITKRAVQENDMGNVPPLLSKNMGSLLFQFRSFVIGAWEKHLLTNLHHRDFETAMQFTLQTTFAGLAYVGMTHTKTIGMGDREKKRYAKDRLTPEAIGTAAFARSGWASITPGAVDTAMWFGGYEQLFSHSRGSGLDQNFITGSPSVSTITRLNKAVRGPIAAAVNPDYEYSRQDLNALRYSLPMANLLGVHNVYNFIGDSLNLPERSTKR